jgi:hypothetical protein
MRAFSEVLPRSVSAKTLNLQDVQDVPVAMEGEAFDLVGILSGVDETAYLWDIQTDQISWESNAVKVLAVRNAQAIETGAEFRFHVATEHSRRRDDAILGANGRAGDTSPTTGLPYRVQYRLHRAAGGAKRRCGLKIAAVCGRTPAAGRCGHGALSG